MKILALNLFPERQVENEGLFIEILDSLKKGELRLPTKPDLLILPLPVIRINVVRISPLKKLALEIYSNLIRSSSMLSRDIKALRTLNSFREFLLTLSPESILRRVSAGGLGLSLIFGVRIFFKIPGNVLRGLDLNLSGVFLDLTYFVPYWSKEPLLTVWQMRPVPTLKEGETEGEGCTSSCEEDEELLESERELLVELLQKAYKYKWTFEIAESSWQKRMLFWKGYNLILFSCEKPWSFSCGAYPFSREIITNAPTVIINLGAGHSPVAAAKSTERLFHRLKIHSESLVAITLAIRPFSLDKTYPELLGYDYKSLGKVEAKFSNFNTTAKGIMVELPPRRAHRERLIHGLTSMTLAKVKPIRSLSFQS